MSEIDASLFYREHETLPESKLRTKEEWQEFQTKNGRGFDDPIPVIYDRPEQVFDPLNPVFYSARQFVEYARAIPGWPHCLYEANDKANRDRDWDWGFSMGDALALYDKGWEKGFNAIKHGMEDAATAAMLTAMRDTVPVRDMHGGFIDIDSFIRGEPDCMFEFSEEVMPVLHLEVEVDSFVVCTTQADEVLYRGAAIMSAVMALRRLGVFVTLYQKEHCRLTDWSGKSRAHSLTVHLMNQDLTENLSEVLLVLSHPGFYRRVYFQAMAAAWGCADSGLGYQDRNTDDFIIKPGTGKICLPGNFSVTFGQDDNGIDWGNSWSSPRAAEGLVKAMLQCAAQR